MKVSKEVAEEILSTSSVRFQHSWCSYILEVLLKKKIPCNWIFSWTSFKTEKVKSTQPTEPSKHLAVALPVMFFINITHKITCVLTTNYPCLWQNSTTFTQTHCCLNWGKHTVSHNQRPLHTSLTAGTLSCLPPSHQGCFDHAEKHKIPSEHHLPPPKKPSLQWFTCYLLGEKDKVGTELLTIA